MRYRDDVGGDEIARHVVERDLTGHPHVRGRRPARRTAPGRIDAHEGQDDPGPERADRLDQVVHTLVASRRPEKHDDLAVAHAEPRARGIAIVAGGVPGFRVAHVRQERPAETALQEARGHGDRIRKRHELLDEPRPRQPVRIGEVEGATGSAPGAGAREEADLPIVDVQHERPFAPGPGE